MAASDESNVNDLRLRPVVLWHGPTLSGGEAAEFERRGLLLEGRDENLELWFPKARALVVVQQGASAEAALAFLRVWGRRALDHGLAVVTITADETSSRAISEGYQRLRWAQHPRARMREAPPTHEIAETIARCDPGPPASRKVVISGVAAPEASLPKGVRFLLSRAFHDCSKLIVDPLPGGRAARVYRVQALLDRSVVGPHPLPFFAKAHFRNAITDELDRYREFVAGFVPGHLHPRIDERRCVEGATESLLVGGFVESSESLMNAVARGMGEGPLHSLFAHALRGWHTQAFASEARDMRLIDSLEWRDLDVRSEIVKLARPLGLQEEAARLIALLHTRPPIRHRVGPIHGDLHAGNVQVRNGEAILIDFRSTRSGPITADLAALETSIAFDRFAHASGSIAWTKVIDDLYTPANIDRPPEPLLSHCSEAWLWGALRHIRQQASFLVTHPHEYRELLTLYLLRRACFRIERDHEGDDYRRAYALVLAERLLRSLAGVQ